METKIIQIQGGTVTSAAGFHAGATAAGIKKPDDSRLDLGILYSEEPCVAAGVLTTNRVQSAPVHLCRQRLDSGRASAIVACSGCANASTGEEGLVNAGEMASLTAEGLGIDAEAVLVASTGVIGPQLPMDRIRQGLRHISLSDAGGHELAQAIMTTDTIAKEVAVLVQAGETSFTIGGIAKGSGMIHPNMATLLAFLTTDAAIEPEFLRKSLRDAADVSFNMVSIDGDTSPSDTLLLLANGRASNDAIGEGSRLAAVFQEALQVVCIHLAKAVARDGEGATKLIEVTVNGAASIGDARLAARTVASSPLLKSAVYGLDPNWGRIVAALGRSGAELSEAKLDVAIGQTTVLRGGAPQPFDEAAVVAQLKKNDVSISADLNLGAASATAWGCDLTEEYVVINSQYTT